MDVCTFVFQVRFIDAESATIAEEVYDHLQSAKLAIDALHSMMAPPAKYRKDIGKRFIAKVGLIIKKFMAGTKHLQETFHHRISSGLHS